MRLENFPFLIIYEVENNDNFVTDWYMAGETKAEYLIKDQNFYPFPSPNF